MVRLIREYEFRSLISKFEHLFSGVATPKIEKKIYKKDETIDDDFDTPISQVSLIENVPETPEHWNTAFQASVGLWILNSDMVHPTIAEVLRETETDSADKALAVILKKLKEKKLLNIFNNIEKPLIPIVQAMTDHGYEFQIGEPAFISILNRANPDFEYEITSITKKDSLDLTDEDRKTIFEAVKNFDTDKIVITHGTDTIHITAKVLSEVKNKTIILKVTIKF
jgi:hypothetical protein